MAPGSTKRKRDPERQDSQDEGRPSPHRPDQLTMAQHSPRFAGRGRGDNRRGRGGFRGHAGYGKQPLDDRKPRPPRNELLEPAAPIPHAQPPAAAPSPAPAQIHAPPKASLPRATPVSREPSPPLEDEIPFEYDFFTDDRISTWEEGGRDGCKDSIMAVTDLFVEATWIQELVHSVIRKRLGPRVAGAFFADINEAKITEDDSYTGSELFADTVALLHPSDWKRTAFSQLVFASGIPVEVWRIVLEADCIEALGMARERFSRRKVMKTTNHLYRQANFNLLREESEGYAKLMTEYFSIAQNASAFDSPPTIALDAFDRVKALIGSFDLDVGRVLDITLDVFANLLVRNFRFFVKFIRASSWWPSLDCPDLIKWEGQGFDPLPEWALPDSSDWGVGQEEVERTARLAPLIEARDIKFWQDVKERGIAAFNEIGAKRIVNFDQEAVIQLLNTEIQPGKDDIDGKGVEKNMVKRQRTNNRRKWMLAMKTLPPLGNPEAADMLGFKLSFYTSPARDPEDVMPDNLIYLSALLIKIGFISLRDLYKHLYPSDEAMSEVKTKLEKELEDREYANRPGGGPNKLAMAGALPDDTLPGVPAVKSLKEAANASKASSPKPESAPKVEPQTELPEPPNQKILLLKSLLAIGAIPDALFILGKFPWLADLVPDLPDYIHRILHHMISKVYEDVRPMQTRSDLTKPSAQVVNSTGPRKTELNLSVPGTKPPKRWAQIDKADDGDGIAYKFYWDDWSLDVPMCQSIDDVFLLCGTFLNFSGVKIGKDPALLVKLCRIGRRSLAADRSLENESRWIDLLKRLLVPALSLTSNNPGTANEVYNLLRLFPTSTRYSIYAEWHFGPTARLPDVKRAFDRTRLEARDVLKRISKTNLKKMGKALAKVAYASPGIVLQTAINQIESYDNLIEVFVECSRYFTFLGYDILTWCLLNALGGGTRSRIQDDGMLTSSWLHALANFAGAIYKRYPTCEPNPVLHYIANELRNGQSTDLALLEQLIVSMVGIKSDMAYNDSQIFAMAGGAVLRSQTLKHMADERHKNDKSAQRLIKALTDSDLAGQILVAISQERQVYSTRESAKGAPLKVLGNNIDKIHQILVQYLEALRSGCSTQEFAQLIPDPLTLMSEYGLVAEVAFMIGRNGIAADIAAIDAQKKTEKVRSLSNQHEQNGDVDMVDSGGNPASTSAKAGPGDVEMEATEAIVEDDANPDLPATKAPEAAPDVWHPALLPFIERVPAVLGEDFASTMSVPFYVTFWTLGLQDILVNNTAYDQELAHQSSLAKQIMNDRSDPSAVGQREKDRKIREVNDLKESLGKEMRGQIAAYTQMRNRLSKEKDHWFTGFHNRILVLHNSLFQNCFLPRILLSPLDAQFTFTMIKFLHNNGTPGFRTMHMFDLFFRKVQLGSLIFSVTAREAENLGRFASESMKELMAWHADQAVYEKNAYGNKRQLPGFAKKLDENLAPTEFLSFEDFRHLLYKWQSYLGNAIKACLESTEYMHIRNAIIVLKAMPPSFPVVNFTVSDLVTKVTELSQTETRGDLKLAALSLLGNLKPQEKLVWLPNEFKFANGKRGSTAAAASATTNGQKTTATTLNAEAPVFKPKSTATEGQQEAEEGEIDDDPKKDAVPETSGDAMDVDKQPVQGRPRSMIQAKKQEGGSAVPSRSQTPRPSNNTPAARDGLRNTPVPAFKNEPARNGVEGGRDNSRLPRPNAGSQQPTGPNRDLRTSARDTPRGSQPPSTPTIAAQSAGKTTTSNAGANTAPATAKDAPVNPGRMALIEGAQNSAAAQAKRNDDGRGSRGNSPRRAGPAPSYNENRQSTYGDRRMESGPRPFADSAPRRPGSEVFDSRPPSRAHQDVNYGRLNAQSSQPTAQAPPGPRSSNALGPRGTQTGPQAPAQGEPQGNWQNRNEPRGRPGPGNVAPAPASPADGLHPARRGRIDPPASGYDAGRPQSSGSGVTTPGARFAGNGPGPDEPRGGRQFAEINQALQGSSAPPAQIRGRGARPNGSLPAQDSMAPPQPGRAAELGRNGSVRTTRGSDQQPGFRGGPAGYDNAYRDVDPRSRGPGPQGRDDFQGYPPQDTRGQYRDDYARGPARGPNYPPDDRGYGPGPDTFGPRRPMDDNRGPNPGPPGGRPDYRGPDNRGGYAGPRQDFRDDRGPPMGGRHDDRKRRAEDLGPEATKRRRDGQ